MAQQRLDNSLEALVNLLYLVRLSIIDDESAQARTYLDMADLVLANIVEQRPQEPGETALIQEGPNRL
jgi:hypothetical protein